jgi:amidohydrolase
VTAVDDGVDLHGQVGAVVALLGDELVALRRDLHAHPEPSWEEHRTTAALLERLELAGLHPEPGPTGTGVVCDIGTGGPVVAIRGDIDALRVTDEKDVPYRSTVDGVCHACGHDLHAVAALGAGLAAAATLEATGRAGTVRLILQPAEEAIPGGASAMVAAGVMDDVGAVFALHADPSLPVGEVGVGSGPITSAADQLRIVLRGPGGHTGRPHQSVDLVHLAARVVVDLPMGLGRLSDPRDGLHLTFGSLQAGHAPNVIPTEAILLGSLRSSGRTSWEQAPPRVRSLLAAIVEPLGGSWELEHHQGAPPVVNHPWAVGLATTAAAAVVGAGALQPVVQSAGGEDFSWYGDHAPLCYLRLGVRGPGAPVVDLHSGLFDIDEAAVAIGARVLAGAALEALADLTAAAAPPA